MNVMLPRNTKVPARATKHFTTVMNLQSRIKFAVLQGDQVAAEENTELAKVTLGNLPLLPAGECDIEVTFDIDVNGILTLTAEDLIEKNKTDLKIACNK